MLTEDGGLYLVILVNLLFARFCFTAVRRLDDVNDKAANINKIIYSCFHSLLEPSCYDFVLFMNSNCAQEACDHAVASTTFNCRHHYGRHGECMDHSYVKRFPPDSSRRSVPDLPASMKPNSSEPVPSCGGNSTQVSG